MALLMTGRLLEGPIRRRIAEAVAEAYRSGYFQGWAHSSYSWAALVVSVYLVVQIRKRLR